MELKHKGLLELTTLPDYETIFGEQAEAVYPLLSEKQNKAIHKYCAHGGIDKADACYDQINECIEMISNNKPVELPNKFYKSATRIVSSFEHSTEIKIPVLYRGIRRQIQAEHLAKLKVGDTYQSKQAMSTSHSAFVAFSNLDQNVALKIFNVRGIPLRHNHLEGEVLVDPNAKFRIKDIYLEDWDDGNKTKSNIIVYELVMLPSENNKSKPNSKKHVIEFFFYMISSLFFISMVRASILLPQLFKSSNAYRFSPDDVTISPDQRQQGLVFSILGLGQPLLIVSIASFIVLGFCVFILPYGKKVRNLYIKMAGVTITTSGILITIFSVWRSS